MTRPNPNRRVRAAKRAREIRDWRKLAERTRERLHPEREDGGDDAA